LSAAARNVQGKGGLDNFLVDGLTGAESESSALGIFYIL